MACEVKTFAKILDFKKVQEFFGLLHDESWLASVNYAISPTSDLIAIGQGEKLALLSSSWDNKLQINTFSMNWCGELDDPNQIITSVLCMPIYGKHSTCGVEWTCVALGLSSGAVNFYNDSGIKIFSQVFQEDPVLAIKAATSQWSSDNDSFIHIIYDQCVCFIKGADLFPLLNYFKQNRSQSVNHRSMNDLEVPETVSFNKFKFSHDRETVINDAIVVGSPPIDTFQHIVEHSLNFGFYAKVPNSPVQRSLIVGVGVQPYMGLYYAEEGYKLFSLGDVAKDVIGIAYKSFFGNFFRSSTQGITPSDESANNIKESMMRSHCRIFDGKRDGYKIWIAPNKVLAAIADNLDRVILIDCVRGVALRVWKGYRDAQCAFICVKEKKLKNDKSKKRKALFLIIYAPHLGCLEIWALQNAKVAAFNLTKNGQLSYNNHGLFCMPPGSQIKSNLNVCLFLDPSDQSLKEIKIPFHFALSQMNSKTSRDVHLMRRLKNLLINNAKSTEEHLVEIDSFCSEFQTIEVRLQCLEMLAKKKQIKPQIFRSIVYGFAKSLKIENDNSSAAEQAIHLQQLLEKYKKLVDFYVELKEPYDVDIENELKLSNRDLETIELIINLLCSRQMATKVTFEKTIDSSGDFVEYLNVFLLDQTSIGLNPEKCAFYGSVGEILFKDIFEKGLNMKRFEESLENSNIPCKDILVLALRYWLEKKCEYGSCEDALKDMSRLANVIRAICNVAGNEIVNSTYNSISPWWQAVRELLLESPRSLGLLVAIVCRTVAIELRRNEISADEDEEHWEQISHDEAQWSLLIGKLDDIAVLEAILGYPMKSSNPIMPEMPYEIPDCSLKAIILGGKGIVTDLTAQWLTNSRLHPLKIYESNNTFDKESSTDEISTSSIDNDPILEKLTHLRKHFPFSLESGVLMSLMSWQYMVYWSKNLQSLQHMRAGLICLAAFNEKDFALKHGMCCMIWNATLKYPLQSTMRLIQECGRLPSEIECQQEIGMTPTVIPEFLELCLDFFEHFKSSIDHSQIELKFEETLIDGPLPLQFIALQQQHAIKEILQLHIELCKVLHFITFFQLKCKNPITMVFDAMACKTFFTDINKELSYVLPSPDQILQGNRIRFLCKVISASMDLIREDLQEVYVIDHVDYMKKICTLADEWKLDKTGIKRHQLVKIYANGWDKFAEEQLLPDFADDQEAGEFLLEIAGVRLNLYAKGASRRFLKVASVGQRLLHYLDELKEEPENAICISASTPDEIDIRVLTKLAANAFKCLSKKETKYIHIAGQMYDACCLLQQMS